MGNWDRNNYLAVIKTRDNITDSVYLDYCIQTDMNVSIEEYKRFMQDHPTSTHPVAERAVEFICLYQGGRMKPDKWGYGEPLKLEFNDETNCERFLPISQY